MRTAVIGAGKMGQWFTRFFLGEGDSVIVSSQSQDSLLKLKKELGVEIADNISAVRKADRVLICVPIDNFHHVIREIHTHVQTTQVIMDICSVKEMPVKTMHQYIKRGITLGTHPMFGPGAKNIKNQNFVLTPVTKKERIFAEDFKDWLTERQARVSIMSPREHDHLMTVVLGLPRFLGLVVCDMLLNHDDFAETLKVAGPTYKMVLTLAQVVASEEAEFYPSLLTNLQETGTIEGLLHNKMEEWLKIVRQRDQRAIAKNIMQIKQKLEKIEPNYAESYEAMHRLLSALEN